MLLTTVDREIKTFVVPEDSNVAVSIPGLLPGGITNCPVLPTQLLVKRTPVVTGEVKKFQLPPEPPTFPTQVPLSAKLHSIVAIKISAGRTAARTEESF